MAFVRRKAFLLCKNPCGAGCDGGRGPHRRSGSPRAKKFPEEICFAPSRVYQACRTPRLQSAQKYAGTLDWYNQPYRAARGARGAAAPLFPKESRGNPFKGFLWATSSRRLDTALLCAAKKRGVELNQLEGLCQTKLALAATAGSNDYSSSCSGSTRSIEITRLPSSTRIKITPCVSRL